VCWRAFDVRIVVFTLCVRIAGLERKGLSNKHSCHQPFKDEMHEARKGRHDGGRFPYLFFSLLSSVRMCARISVLCAYTEMEGVYVPFYQYYTSKKERTHSHAPVHAQRIRIPERCKKFEGHKRWRLLHQVSTLHSPVVLGAYRIRTTKYPSSIHTALSRRAYRSYLIRYALPHVDMKPFTCDGNSAIPSQPLSRARALVGRGFSDGTGIRETGATLQSKGPTAAHAGFGA
jgi:hypothetical protein